MVSAGLLCHGDLQSMILAMPIAIAVAVAMAIAVAMAMAMAMVQQPGLCMAIAYGPCDM